MTVKSLTEQANDAPSTAHIWESATPSAITLSPDRDVEKAVDDASSPQLPDTPDLTDTEDEGWDPDDPELPVNWTNSRKWRVLLTVSMLTYLTPFASSMIAPATEQIMHSLDTTNRDIGSFAVSIYLLGYAFGPLIIAPCSELYGRLVVYHTCSVLFLILNLGCALAKNMPMLIVFRFLTGTVGACPFTVGPSTVGECFKQEERGRAMAVMNLPVLLGPCLGPAVGAYLTRAVGWRWDFWLIMMMSGVILTLSLVFLRETHPPTLLKWKLKKLGKSNIGKTTEKPSEDAKLAVGTPSPTHLFLTSITRPIKMLFLSPIILGLSLLATVTYGVLYLLFTTLGDVFRSRYGIVTNVGLMYFGIGFGQIAGITAFGSVSDAVVKRMAKGGEMKPEYRLPPMVPGAAMIPVGLLLYGWTAQYYVHWFVPLLGNFFIGVGVITVFVPINTYLVDAFPAHAASATAANTVFRSIGGALLPLAGPRMYDKLGQGWGNTLLAGISLVMIGMVLLTIKYGEALRTHPRYQLKL